MIRVKVKDKSYQVKSEWADITIKDAGNILMIERSQRLAIGSAEYSKHEGADEDGDYSDIVTLKGDIKWRF